MECAGCQQAGRPHHAPPPSLEAHSRPAPSLKAAAGPSHPSPVSCTRTGKFSPLAVSGEVRERAGAKGFSQGLPERTAGAPCPVRIPASSKPGKGRPAGGLLGPGRELN